MPHVTEHTPKVSTRSVKPYACESSREKRQQDRRSDRQTDRRIVQNHFSRRFEGSTSQIRSFLEVDVLHDANTSIDMEVIRKVTRQGLGLSCGQGDSITVESLRTLYTETKRRHFLTTLVCVGCLLTGLETACSGKSGGVRRRSARAKAASHPVSRQPVQTSSVRKRLPLSTG